MELKEKIRHSGQQYLDDIIAIRRHLHEYPELSFQEKNTSDYLCSLLESMNIPYRKGIAGTGVTAFIYGKKPESRLIALRAEMDALPVEEKNEIPYRSKNSGVMHACGHDAHMAILIGCCRILNELREHFQGTVQIIFQPGEERLPGGALKMLEEGVFADRAPEVIIGQHVQPDMEAGKLGFRPGPYMASTDELYFTVIGKGGHGAMPHTTIDPVPIAAQTILALQQLVSRRANPTLPSVLSIGKVIATGATNVIPDQVTMEGTFRTFDENWRREAHRIIRAIAENTAKAAGGSCDCTILNGYPVLVNHEECTRKAIRAATEFLGNENIIPLDLRMTSEDFAYYSQKYPSVFYRLGTMTPGSSPEALHTPCFNIFEPALATGMTALAWIALSFLASEK